MKSKGLLSDSNTMVDQQNPVLGKKQLMFSVAAVAKQVIATKRVSKVIAKYRFDCIFFFEEGGGEDIKKTC